MQEQQLEQESEVNQEPSQEFHINVDEARVIYDEAGEVIDIQGQYVQVFNDHQAQLVLQINGKPYQEIKKGEVTKYLDEQLNAGEAAIASQKVYEIRDFFNESVQSGALAFFVAMSKSPVHVHYVSNNGEVYNNPIEHGNYEILLAMDETAVDVLYTQLSEENRLMVAMDCSRDFWKQWGKASKLVDSDISLVARPVVGLQRTVFETKHHDHHGGHRMPYMPTGFEQLYYNAVMFGGRRYQSGFKPKFSL